MVKVITDISECCSPRGCTNTVEGVYNLLGGYVPNCTACSTIFFDEITKNNLFDQTIHNRLRKTTLHYAKQGFGRKRLSGCASASYVTPDYAFIDNFNEDTETPLDEHIPNVGGAWTVESGLALVDDGYLTLDQVSPMDRRIIITNDFGVADATLTFSMLFTAGFESGMSIQFNRQDDANYWSLYHSPPYMILFERTDSIQEQRGEYTGTFGYTTMKLDIVTDGDDIIIYKDDVEVIAYSTEDRSNQNATEFKIDWFKNSGTLQFDKISAIPPFNPP